MEAILIVPVVCLTYAIAARAAVEAESPLVGGIGLFLVLCEFIVSVVIAVK